jgi:ElaB/YqjD/DUF883 family membrane-anchored ribosome-binding protein
MFGLTPRLARETRGEREERLRGEEAELSARMAAERALLAAEPAGAQANYRLARRSMALCLPAFGVISACGWYAAGIAAALALLIGGLLFHRLAPAHGPYAAIPFASMLAGLLIGLFLLRPAIAELFGR